jgi:hypothetical protein
MINRLLLSLVFTFSFITPVHAQFDDLKFKQALKLKKDFYITDGSITGGDRLSSDFSITNVRIANNPAGYDRIVIDLSGNQLGKKIKLDRPPFYMIQNDSENKRVLVTLYGKPKLDFSTQSSIQSAKKAKHISDIEFIPLTEQDRWTWAIHTKTSAKAEVFELTEPARIIIDLKQ